MDFKYINDRNMTPKAKAEKMFSSTVTCDSPFKLLPNFSTPPSRFSKITNPFERHLLDRLHLPTFSPSVFAKVSTPKSEEKFKWTIDDISSLKPADIDEGTLSQHVFDEDPQIESLVQEKINKFFSEKQIVPSPMTEVVVRVPLITDDFKDSPSPLQPKQYSQSSAQTVLTLPPVLPSHVEEILKPYFTHTEDQQNTEPDLKDTSLYHHLFEFDQSLNRNSSSPSSIHTSPALSTGLSPIQYSPFDKRESLASDIPELRECSLSPILRKSPREAKSACRLNFSAKMGMSVDSSLIVPDIADQMSSQSVLIASKDNSLLPLELLSDSTVNWEMEYRHVSLTSPCSTPESEKMDVSNSNTPHSKMFTSQRKRLSHSFKDEENYNKENEPQSEDIHIRQNRKLFKNDVTDAGYHTETTAFFDESVYSSHVFASTPTKRKQED